MKLEFEVKTTHTKEGVIVQELFTKHNEIREQMARRVIDTQDQQIRDTLIALGWTPPKP